MLKIIELASPDGALNESAPLSSIVKRDQIARAREVSDVLAKAQARADELIRNAEQTAIEIHAAAFREGAYQGIQAVLEPVNAMLTQWEVVNRSIREAVASALRDCLDDLFGRDIALSALLEAVLAAHLPEQPERLNLRVPPGVDIKGLTSRCEALGVQASIEVDDASGTFSIAWHGHVWTAHLGEIEDLTLADALVRSVRLPVGELQEICRVALLEAAQRLEVKNDNQK